MRYGLLVVGIVLGCCSTLRAEGIAREDSFGDPLPGGALVRMGTVRLRQRQGAMGVAFSPAGTRLASCGWGDSIRLWDVRSGRTVRRFRGSERNGSFAVAFSPDGAKMASVGEGGLVRLWDVATGEELWKAERHKGRTFGVAFAPDGLTFATAGGDKSIRLWDAATGEEILELNREDRFHDHHAVAFSPDGRLLASGAGKAILVWDLEAGGEPRVIDNVHGRELVSLVFAPDGKALLSGGHRFVSRTTESGVRVARQYSEICRIALGDVDQGERLKRWEAEEPDDGDCCVALSEDGKLLASAHRDKIRLWDPSSGDLTRTIRAAENRSGRRTHGVAISSAANVVAATWGDNKIRLWDITTGDPLLEQRDCHLDAVLSAQFSPDGKVVVTGGADHVVRLWDAQTGKPLRSLAPGTGWVRSAFFASDGQTVVAGCEAFDDERFEFVGEVRLFNAATGGLLRTTPLSDRVTVACLSHDGGRLAAAIGLGRFGPGGSRDADPGCPIHIRDVATGNKLAELRGHEARVFGLAFTAENDTLVSVSEDKTVRRWDLEGAKEQERFAVEERFFSAALSGDAKTLIVGETGYVPESQAKRYHGKIRCWDVAAGQPRLTIETPDQYPRHFAISPDGRVLAAYVGANSRSPNPFDNRLALWDLATGRELLRFPLDDGHVRCLSFSPNGTRLASGMDRGTALVWDVSEAKNDMDTSE